MTLKNSKPPIWRRIQVRGSTTLAKFHTILQIVMGLTDSHLHQFIVGDTYYSVPDPEWGMEIKNERSKKLGQVIASPKDRFVYEYGFCDSWHHELLVEKVLAPTPGMHDPVGLAGKRACPPEDVGGIGGDAEFLEAIQDPKHTEHEMMLTWVGGDFDPKACVISSHRGIKNETKNRSLWRQQCKGFSD